MFASIKLTEVDNATIDSNANMWWVRKSVETTELLNGNVNGRTSPIRPLDAISSMTEFLARERLCKVIELPLNKRLLIFYSVETKGFHKSFHIRFSLCHTSQRHNSLSKIVKFFLFFTSIKKYADFYFCSFTEERG